MADIKYDISFETQRAFRELADLQRKTSESAGVIAKIFKVATPAAAIMTGARLLGRAWEEAAKHNEKLKKSLGETEQAFVNIWRSLGEGTQDIQSTWHDLITGIDDLTGSDALTKSNLFNEVPERIRSIWTGEETGMTRMIKEYQIRLDIERTAEKTAEWQAQINKRIEETLPKLREWRSGHESQNRSLRGTLAGDTKAALDALEAHNKGLAELDAMRQGTGTGYAARMQLEKDKKLLQENYELATKIEAKNRAETADAALNPLIDQIQKLRIEAEIGLLPGVEGELKRIAMEADEAKKQIVALKLATPEQEKRRAEALGVIAQTQAMRERAVHIEESQRLAGIAGEHEKERLSIIKGQVAAYADVLRLQGQDKTADLLEAEMKFRERIASLAASEALSAQEKRDLIKQTQDQRDATLLSINNRVDKKGGGGFGTSGIGGEIAPNMNMRMFLIGPDPQKDAMLRMGNDIGEIRKSLNGLAQKVAGAIGNGGNN